MATIISSTGTNEVKVQSAQEAKHIQQLLGKYGIKVGVGKTGEKAV